jgi:hypothetical protein
VLANRRTAADILGRRMTACALLIKALGGGWDSSALPSAKELNQRDGKQQSRASMNLDPRAGKW